MYYIFSLITGLLITIMVFFNGELSKYYDIFITAIVIHLVGLIFITILQLIKKEPFFKHKKVPPILYLGGTIGYLTIMFNNLAFGKISISSLIALSLLGQTITSLVVDRFGMLGLEKQKLNYKKFLGIFFVLLGIFFMMSDFRQSMILPAIFSFLTGVTVVSARTLNAKLAQSTSLIIGTWYNHITGLFVAFLTMLIFKSADITYALPAFNFSHSWIYLGGIIGVFVILLSNIAIVKIPSFYATLFLFIGQISTSIVLDILLTQKYSQPNIIGGLLVAVGLTINLFFEKKETSNSNIKIKS